MSAPASPRRVELRIDSRLDQVQLLARALHALCAASGLESRAAALVELALVEAVNNVIRHAYRLEPGHLVEVAFESTDGVVRFEVTDRGRRFTGPLTPHFEFDPADTAHLPEGGMGLHLIHSIMDHVAYDSREGRNTLSMTKRLAA